MEQFGKLLMIAGGVFVLAGLFLTFGPKLPLNFHYQRGNFSFFFPLGTSILISVVLTVLFALFNRGR
jgi:hypothetical protein